jgi:DNA-binding CsgD family transcriptional regulator
LPITGGLLGADSARAPSRSSLVRRCYLRSVSPENGSDPRLTLREKEIVRLVAEGYSYWEVTDILAVGSGVVRTHMQRIYEKLQLRGGRKLVHWYTTHKVDLDP